MRLSPRFCASKLTIFGFPLSQPTRSVLMLCKDSSIPYTFRLVDALKGENRKPEFRKIHPAGLLPAISVDEKFVLGESAAIMQYLADANKLHEWYPTELETRANVNFWLHWNGANTRVSTKKLLVTKIFPPKTGAPEALASAVKELAIAVSFIEGHLSRNNTKFLVGSSPTLADLAIITEIDQQSPTAFNLFDYTPYPLVQQWMKSCEEVIKSYKEVFQPVQEIALKFKDK